MTEPWQQIEQLMWRDPGGRGVAGYLYRGRPLAEGQLAAAVESLAQTTGAIAIATGFWIPRPRAEPPKPMVRRVRCTWLARLPPWAARWCW